MLPFWRLECGVVSIKICAYVPTNARLFHPSGFSISLNCYIPVHVLSCLNFSLWITFYFHLLVLFYFISLQPTLFFSIYLIVMSSGFECLWSSAGSVCRLGRIPVAGAFSQAGFDFRSAHAMLRREWSAEFWVRFVADILLLTLLDCGSSIVSVLCYFFFFFFFFFSFFSIGMSLPRLVTCTSTGRPVLEIHMYILGGHWNHEREVHEYRLLMYVLEIPTWREIPSTVPYTTNQTAIHCSRVLEYCTSSSY